MTISDYLVLHFFTELALYALDVYSQQTFANSHSHTSKVDTERVGNQYGQYQLGNSKRKPYPDYPPYYDYFHGTYRNFSPEWKDLDKILVWIQAAFDT